MIEIDIGGKVAPEEVTAVSSELSKNGFKVMEGYRVGFITEPGRDR